MINRFWWSKSIG